MKADAVSAKDAGLSAALAGEETLRWLGMCC